MEETRIRFLRCPYCGTPGGHKQKVGKSVGLFRIKELYTNILILQCQKCLKICRVRKMGTILKWEDMTPEEREVFQTKRYQEFKTKSKEAKNGKEIHNERRLS
jgi:hypothetical protein